MLWRLILLSIVVFIGNTISARAGVVLFENTFVPEVPNRASGKSSDGINSLAFDDFSISRDADVTNITWIGFDRRSVPVSDFTVHVYEGLLSNAVLNTLDDPIFSATVSLSGEDVAGSILAKEFSFDLSSSLPLKGMTNYLLSVFTTSPESSFTWIDATDPAGNAVTRSLPSRQARLVSDNNSFSLTGEYDTVSEVPVPGAMLFLITGLAGLTRLKIKTRLA